MTYQQRGFDIILMGGISTLYLRRHFDVVSLVGFDIVSMVIPRCRIGRDVSLSYRCRCFAVASMKMFRCLIEGDVSMSYRRRYFNVGFTGIFRRHLDEGCNKYTSLMSVLLFQSMTGAGNCMINCRANSKSCAGVFGVFV